MQARLIPVDSHERIRLIGHHHLCVGAFVISRSICRNRLRLWIFCYYCGYFSREEGRCISGWINKNTKHSAVLDHLGLKPGCQACVKNMDLRSDN